MWDAIWRCEVGGEVCSASTAALETRAWTSSTMVSALM